MSALQGQRKAKSERGKLGQKVGHDMEEGEQGSLNDRGETEEREGREAGEWGQERAGK